jgi:hypothetical protein
VGAADVVALGALFLLALGVVLVIMKGSFTRDGGAAPGSLTAFHDFANADRQRAMEVVVEQKAGKAWVEQESGEGADPASGLESNPSRSPLDEAGAEGPGEGGSDLKR